MSAPGPSEPNPGSVVPNSALSFLPAQAPTQGMMNESQNGSHDTKEASDQGVSTEPLVPAGVKALCDACSRLYPDQPNPLQVTTRLKYWLGGQDPLDYISMYWHPGKPDLDVPPHWHYISFGISDLHGDGRVHVPADRVLVRTPVAPPSGFGFEVTMRVEGGTGGSSPPLWPAAMLHSIARYVFFTGNKLVAGDHISWHAPLDGVTEGRRSRIRHLLVAEDPALKTIYTEHGSVAFLQLVGCTSRELKAAQRNSGHDVLKAMAKSKSCGGSYLVTSSNRRRSVRLGVGGRGGPGVGGLAGVTASVHWRGVESTRPTSPLPRSVSDQIKETLQRGLSSMSTSDSFQRSAGDNQGHMSTDSFEMSSIKRALPQIPENIQESPILDDEEVKYYDSVHLTFNPEAASLLPLAIESRVSLGGHFTWRQAGGGAGVTVLSSRVLHSLVDPRRPRAARRDWLQVLIPSELCTLMTSQLSHLSALSETDSETDDERQGDGNSVTSPRLPLHYSWPEYGLEITVTT